VLYIIGVLFSWKMGMKHMLKKHMISPFFVLYLGVFFYRHYT